MGKIPIKFVHHKYFGLHLQTPQTFFRNMPYILNTFDLVSSNKPKFVFCKKPIKRGQYKRIYFNLENVRPNIKDFDWSFGSDYEDYVRSSRYLRIPNYTLLGCGKNLIKEDPDYTAIMERKTKFCAFIYFRDIPIRNRFFDMVSKYKKVDAPGKSKKNMSAIGPYDEVIDSRMKNPNVFKEKQKFLEQYKFCIAFENSSYPGYTSEKIYDAMVANCIPVYWGNPLIYRDFNRHSFITGYSCSVPGKKIFEYLLEKMIELDKDDDAYLKTLKEPWYNGNKLNTWVRPNRILKRFKQIFG